MATATAAPTGELTATDADSAAEDVDLDPVIAERDSGAGDGDGADPTPTPTPAGSAARWMLAAGVAALVGLVALVGWLTYRAQHVSAAQHQRDVFVQVARQGALNLTTIDWQHADTDVDRILDTATGSFHDDFATKSAPFVEVVKHSKSTTVGTVTEAGVESQSDGSAQVLVAVTVKTSNAVAPEQETRAWRMRVGVQKVGADVKVANVEFVP